MNQEILDHTLHSYLHKILAELPANQQLQTKSLRLCGKKIVPQKGLPTAVYLISNGQRSKFIGNTLCKNTWACPVCSAYMMSKYSSEIASAIEMKRAEGYMAFMMTLTVPHLRFMTCRTVTDILFETYSYFRRTAKQKNYRPQKRTGSVSKQFFDDLAISDYVNVCEYTWGVNGWHPHFHMLLWTKRENAQKIMDWQAKLNEFWLKTAKRITEKHLSKVFTENFAVDYVNRLYTKAEEGAGVYISNDNGVVRESLTSDYIAGWGADKELTGNRRKEASHAGHYTPYQILEAAYYGNAEMKKLYIEFVLQVTRKPVHHRVLWSKNGFKARLNNYRQSLKAKELLKKKENEDAEWKVVCWFTLEQWKDLCYKNDEEPVLANILFMCNHARDILFEYFESIGIKMNPPNENCRRLEEILAVAV